MKVKDCMCGNVCYCKLDTKIKDIAQMMKDYKIGCIPVCDDNDCIMGIITDRDITLRSVACGKDTQCSCAKDIMTSNATCCDCNEDIEKVTKSMGENGVRRIPVTENGKIVGILTLGDFAKHKDISCECVGNTFEKICKCNNEK